MNVLLSEVITLINEIVNIIFICKNLNWNVYFNVAQENLILALTNLFPNDAELGLYDNKIWFQLDGAVAHYA